MSGPRRAGRPGANPSLPETPGGSAAACDRAAAERLRERIRLAPLVRGVPLFESAMGDEQRRGRDVGTVRRHRRQAKKAGLIEVLGRDRKPCLVRPILLDGSTILGNHFDSGRPRRPGQRPLRHSRIATRCTHRGHGDRSPPSVNAERGLRLVAPFWQCSIRNGATCQGRRTRIRRCTSHFVARRQCQDVQVTAARQRRPRTA
jgi:hypothetical protein